MASRLFSTPELGTYDQLTAIKNAADKLSLEKSSLLEDLSLWILKEKPSFSSKFKSTDLLKELQTMRTKLEGINTVNVSDKERTLKEIDRLIHSITWTEDLALPETSVFPITDKQEFASKRKMGFFF